MNIRPRSYNTFGHLSTFAGSSTRKYCEWHVFFSYHCQSLLPLAIFRQLRIQIDTEMATSAFSFNDKCKIFDTVIIYLISNIQWISLESRELRVHVFLDPGPDPDPVKTKFLDPDPTRARPGLDPGPVGSRPGPGRVQTRSFFLAISGTRSVSEQINVQDFSSLLAILKRKSIYKYLLLFIFSLLNGR